MQREFYGYCVGIAGERKEYVMLTKESERAIMEFSKLSQAAVRDYDSIYKEIGELNLLVTDILHELDPRNHIVGLPRKRKVSSKEAMELGLRLKEVVMRRRDLKDTLELYRVIREQVNTREIENVRKFVEGGRSRKYTRRMDLADGRKGERKCL